MNEVLSDSKTYIEVFKEIPQIKAFFATKNSSKPGWPFYNEELFAEVGLADAVHVGHWQTHSDNVQIITQEMVDRCRAGDFVLEYPDDIEEKKKFTSEEYNGGGILFLDSDGAITDIPGVLLTSMHADCIPLFFYDPVKQVIAMVHSGWKGTVKEIGRITSEKMQSVYGCKASDILVHIGPGISKCCFEVDKDVYDMFRDPSFTTKGIKYYIDLKHYNKRMLMETGITEEHITVSDHCTCCETDLFDSYRRDGSKQRMGGGICILPVVE